MTGTRHTPSPHALSEARASSEARETLRVLLGGILIGTIFNGLSILNVSSFYQKISLGALIIFALALEKVVGNISAKTQRD